MRIGIAITTLNRRDTFNDTLNAYRRHTPTEMPIVVVDDGSDVPVPTATDITVCRNASPVGIARAKNQCIATLMDMGCDYLILGDDDCHPVADEYWAPYVKAMERLGQHHFALIHANHDKRAKVISDDGEVRAWNQGTACWLIYTRHAIETVGGFRKEFGRMFGEHDEHQYRVHNAGLTAHVYQDVVDGGTGLYSMDEHQRDINSIGERARRPYYAPAMLLKDYWRNSTDYVPYVEHEVEAHEVTVCLPWRATPDRIPAHDRAVNFWQSHGFKTSEADSDPSNPWLCNQARNNAVRNASTDIIMLADADTLPATIDQIWKAIDLVNRGEANVVWPFDHYLHIPADSVRLEDLSKARVEHEYTHGSPGGIIVASREVYWALGGYDERFVPGAWGFDDDAFMLAAQTLATTRRLPGAVYSINHDVSGYIGGGRDLTDRNPNKARYRRYQRAQRDPTAMRELISR